MLAAAVPAAFISELADTRLPTIVDMAHLGAAFMLTFLFKIMLADYARTIDTALLSPATILVLPSPAAAESSFLLAA